MSKKIKTLYDFEQWIKKLQREKKLVIPFFTKDIVHEGIKKGFTATQVDNFMKFFQRGGWDYYVKQASDNKKLRR